MPPRKPASSAFEDAVEEVLDVEGGFSDHEDDSGGKTNWGVTETLAREYGYTGSIEDMNQTVALDIYRRHFWDWMRLDKVHNVAPRTARELFDAGVNIGRRRVWEWFQMTLNALNRNERDYEDIAVDGWPGPKTLNALYSFIEKRGESGDRVLSRAIDSLQGHHYITLAESKPSQQSFLFGWLNQRVD